MRWEYLHLEVDGSDKPKSLNGQGVTKKHISVVINELGDQGWELVTVYPKANAVNVMLFKRPKP